jgi:hypothetical protein
MFFVVRVPLQVTDFWQDEQREKEREWERECEWGSERDADYEEDCLNRQVRQVGSLVFIR